MSKELTPLEALKRLRNYENLPARNPVAYLLEQDNLPTYYKIIETALKEYEAMKEIRITARFDLAQVNKEHKALEIIKEKQIDMYRLNDAMGFKFENEEDAIEFYNQNYDAFFCITVEEFRLLKEVLYE